MSQDPSVQRQSGQSQGQGGNQRTRSKRSAEKEKKEQQLLHLKVVDRVLKWPMVDTAWHEGNHVYGKIKGMSKFFFFLSTCLLLKLCFV